MSARKIRFCPFRYVTIPTLHTAVLVSSRKLKFNFTTILRTVHYAEIDTGCNMYLTRIYGFNLKHDSLWCIFKEIRGEDLTNVISVVQNSINRITRNAVWDR